MDKNALNSPVESSDRIESLDVLRGFAVLVDRWQQALVVIAVWGIQLWWSPLLLRRFRYGPLEWSWRALTYWRVPRG